MAYYLEYKKTKVEIMNNNKDIIASFPNEHKDMAIKYLEILNCQHDNLATILRQVGEEDGR